LETIARSGLGDNAGRLVEDMAVANMPQLTEATFDSTVARGMTLVDFWAAWCGPCLMQGPILEEVQSRAPDGATIAKLDVDAAPAIAANFGVMSIPTLILFKDGQEVERFVGVQQADSLLAAMKKHT